MSGFTMSGNLELTGNACKIELTRGQRGGYGWVIRYENSDIKNVIEEVKKADKLLRELYGKGGTD